MEIGELPESTPWFPRKMVDLDTFADKVLEMGEELDSDHPGAKDASYRARRAEITKIAKTYKTYVSSQVPACTKPYSSHGTSMVVSFTAAREQMKLRLTSSTLFILD